MADFTRLVEVDFDGTWTDISPYVREAEGIRITRGRGDEQAEVRPGTMSLVLDNRDGRFTPGSPASPYWPNVRKGRPIRASVVVGGITYRRFTGRVNEWPVTFDGGDRLVLSHITATDVFKQLGNLAPMESMLEREMLALGPDAYYTLGEPARSASAGDTSGNGSAALGRYAIGAVTSASTLEFGAGTGPGTDELSAVVYKPEAASIGRLLGRPKAAANNSVVMACWMNTTVKGRAILALANSESIAFTVKTNDTDGKLNFAAANNRSVIVSAGLASSPNLADGTTHLVAVLLKPNGEIYASVDGAASVLAATFAPDANYGPFVDMGAYTFIYVGAGPSFAGPSAPYLVFSGTLSHVWYAERNTMPDWSEAWAAGNSETTEDRFARICRVLGITASTAGGSATVIGAQAIRGKAPLQALRDVAGVEAGLIRASRSDGSVVLECRNFRYALPAPTLILAGLREGDLRWSDDDQHVVNDVTNRRDNGAAQRWTDPDSIAEYGTYTAGDTLPWDSDTAALHNAQWRVSNGADPPPRIARFTVVANALPEHEQILDLDISSNLTLTGLPSGSPVGAVDVIVEGYTETIEFNYHTITYNTSPASTAKVWRLGVAGSSELGVTTKLAL